MKKVVLLVVVCVFLLSSMVACDPVGSDNQEGAKEKATVENIRLTNVPEHPCPTVDCPSTFYQSANISTIGTITVDDLSVTITNPNVVSVQGADFNAYDGHATVKLTISVIGEGECEIYLQSKDGSVKSDVLTIFGMSMEGVADYVIEQGNKTVHTRDCENVSYIRIDKRQYINESDFHYDYRRCEDCMS